MPACAKRSRWTWSKGRPRTGTTGFGTDDYDAWPLASRVTWILERARLADRLGQTETALRDYRFVSQVWADAVPELQPIVREAEEAVARLGG